MLIIGRWIAFLIYVPHVAVYRRWGWFGIVIGWTAIVMLGAATQFVGEGSTSNGELQMLAGGAVLIAFLLWRLNGAHRVRESFSRADEIAGQGVIAMDRLFFRYLASVMQRSENKTDDEIAAAIREHARSLADADPNRAWNYRMAMIEQSAADWPSEASHDFNLELQKHWAPSAEESQQWSLLPAPVRSSYIRQGRAVNGAVMSAFGAAEATAE